jgi:drug/metabolite transporter (DMT)-like permease
MKTVVALLVAVAGSILINWAIYLQKKAVLDLPEVKAKLSWTLVKAFITNKPWILAQAANISGFALYIVALSFAPVSIVEPIIAAGVIIPALLAMRNLGEKPRTLDFVGMGLSILGVILIGLSLLEGLPEDVLIHPYEVWVIAAVIFGLAALVPWMMRNGSANRQAAGLGISVGLLFGIAAVFTRLLLMYWGDSWPLFIIFTLACIAGYLPAFILLQAALQKGMAVVVAPIYNGIMEFVPIVMGMVVLNEKFPHHTDGSLNVPLTALRIIAFVSIITGTVLLSARAEGGEAELVAPGSGAEILREMREHPRKDDT